MCLSQIEINIISFSLLASIYGLEKGSDTIEVKPKNLNT